MLHQLNPLQLLPQSRSILGAKKPQLLEQYAEGFTRTAHYRVQRIPDGDARAPVSQDFHLFRLEQSMGNSVCR